MADYIDKGEIFKEALEDAVEKIKPQVSTAISAAVSEFYGSASPGNYGRAMGFDVYSSIEPAVSIGGNSATLTYTFEPPAVNGWDAPWGVSYPGNPEIALATAYDSGYHGGPKPLWDSEKGTYNFAAWTWSRTQKSTPLAESIIEHIGTLHL